MSHKVLFFDSWKGGLRSFLRLVPTFTENGIHSRLIHLGSWGNEDIIIKDEIIEGLSVRDISYYTNNNFLNILKEEKPDLVIFLSTHTFAHRAFIRYCQFLNVPTINLYHGYVSVQDVENVKGPYKVRFWPYIYFIFKRIPKLILQTIPTYIRSLIKTKANKDDWNDFLKNLLEVVISPSKLKIAKDSRTDFCLIYAKGDTKHAIDKYGFCKSKIIEVGNPDLIDFGLNLNLLNSINLNKSINNKYVMYIDTALTATGLILKSKSEYLQHLIDTNNSLSNKGKILLFKPHPETTRLLRINVLKEHGIIIVDKTDFVEKLNQCCCVISEPSTLAIIPALMGLPIFYAKYDKLKDLNYGEVLTSYPYGTILENIDNLCLILNDLCSKDLNHDFNTWIKHNSGPLPADKMPERVASIVVNMINNRNLIYH
jgi:hypothetical protein